MVVRPVKASFYTLLISLPLSALLYTLFKLIDSIAHGVLGFWGFGVLGLGVGLQGVGFMVVGFRV
jgi:hypothetical protein